MWPNRATHHNIQIISASCSWYTSCYKNALQVQQSCYDVYCFFDVHFSFSSCTFSMSSLYHIALFDIFLFSFFFLFSFKFIPIYFSHASILPHITFFCYLLVFLMSNAGHVFHFFEVVFFWSAIFTFTLRNFLTSFNLLSSYSLWCFTFWS